MKKTRTYVPPTVTSLVPDLAAITADAAMSCSTGSVPTPSETSVTPLGCGSGSSASGTCNTGVSAVTLCITGSVGTAV
ncbi:MAG TPA: hypothetical protein PKL77_04925 [Candidatus Omnitrophota bacterium]|nr:hypothetical protein [Candidatus Omnitrophota bacterium]